MIQRYGFSPAFAVAAALSLFALPYFATVDWFLRRRGKSTLEGRRVGTLGAVDRIAAGRRRRARRD